MRRTTSACVRACGSALNLRRRATRTECGALRMVFTSSSRPATPPSAALLYASRPPVARVHCRGLADWKHAAPSPYVILGLPSHASATEVKQAFRRLALRHHPDVVPLEEQHSARERFEQVSARRCAPRRWRARSLAPAGRAHSCALTRTAPRYKRRTTRCWAGQKHRQRHECRPRRLRLPRRHGSLNWPALRRGSALCVSTARFQRTSRRL